MKRLYRFGTAIMVLFGVWSPALYSASVISEATGLFQTSVRGDSHEAWFGWSSGTFFGTSVPFSSSRILNNAAPTVGTIGLAQGVGFYQNDRYSTPFTLIGASSGNIYTGNNSGQGKQAYGTLLVPTLGTPESGFTTLILQGKSMTADGVYSTPQTLAQNYPLFSLNGVTPFAYDFVIGPNAANQAQWWAKFQIAGNAPTYQIDLVFPGGAGTAPISISEMTVDSYWSSTQYAPDTAVVVPEPSVGWLIGAGLVALMLRRRNQKAF
jgi:hypothetical protein